MSHVRIVSIALAGLALSTLGAAPENPTATKPGAEPELQRLLDTNFQLQKENEALKAEVKFLQTQLAIQQRTLGIEPKTVPPGWKQGKINGMNFYIVPCDEDAKSGCKPTVKLLDK